MGLFTSKIPMKNPKPINCFHRTSANDWDYRKPGALGYDYGSGTIENILVLGIVEGSIRVLEWEDGGLPIPPEATS